MIESRRWDFFGRLRDSLTRTKQQLVERFEEIVSRADAPERRSRAVDVETLEALEELLISADVGLPATERIVSAVKARARRGESLRDLVKQEIRAVFDGVAGPAGESPRRRPPSPRVVLIVGVNGTGKTTTVGKLANLLKSVGRRRRWSARRTRSARRPSSSSRSGRRAPASTSCGRGRAPTRRRWCSTRSRRARRAAAIPILVDTAGRIHTRVNLMNELEKIRRVASREVPGAPHEVLLVLDATVGQNGLSQAREFTERGRRERHRAREARRDGEGRRGGGDRARPEAADPLRGRRRGHRRPGAVLGGGIRATGCSRRSGRGGSGQCSGSGSIDADSDSCQLPLHAVRERQLRLRPPACGAPALAGVRPVPAATASDTADDSSRRTAPTTRSRLRATDRSSSRRAEQLADVDPERGRQLLQRLGRAVSAVDDVADGVGVDAGQAGQFHLGDALLVDQGGDRVAPSGHRAKPTRRSGARVPAVDAGARMPVAAARRRVAARRAVGASRLTARAEPVYDKGLPDMGLGHVCLRGRRDVRFPE